jgi:hypothetical protein
MAMSQSKLSVELQDLVPSESEAEAALVLSQAYANYASDAVAGGAPITEAGVELGRVAMLAALSGMSEDGAGRAIIPAAILAFWDGVAGGVATSFAGAVSITPPPHSGLSSSFTLVLDINVNTWAPLSEAMDNLAATFHAGAITGGSVTFPGPVVSPIV